MKDSVDKYVVLKSEIMSAGFFAVIEDAASGSTDHRVVCASHRRGSGGLCGTSFWVTYRRGGWYLGTWRPEFYELPDPTRIGELCLSLLKEGKGSGPISLCPKRVRRSFQLLKVDDIPAD